MSAFEQGFIAYQQRRSIEANPFPAGDAGRADWQDGWQEAASQDDGPGDDSPDD